MTPACDRCGANLALVGRAHRCVPAATAEPDVANCVANTSHVANSNRPDVANRSSTTYRYRNPDQRRAYQRELMRKRRRS